MVGKNGVPRIGITPYLNSEGKPYIPEGYVQGIERVGGEVVQINYDTPLHTLLPLAASLDAMLFSGGVDVDPKCYGAEREPECGEPNPMRDQLELALLDILMARCTPILGICRGFQLINVGLGGTLTQDIPKKYGTLHQQPKEHDSPFWHELKIVPGTMLRDLMGADTILTDSYHHQAVDVLAEPLRPTAYAKEGFIEAYELKEGPQFLMAVQWHPEKTLDADEISIRPFEALRRAIH
ncbi:MAG: gamma-glutamyl-gamma-aminobutyrate hydrolase family protein [Clostridia bacterium]|nr:gamma-glutamyl-gamma-aminobutyrate hydrolase family protein [Clostridia bacterium]